MLKYQMNVVEISTILNIPESFISQYIGLRKMPLFELKQIMNQFTTVPSEYICPILTEIME